MGATTLQPGETTTLSIETMMHPGMEGPHHFRLTLPVASDQFGDESLAMEVLADFE